MQSIRVFFDNQIFTRDEVGGISTMFAYYLREFYDNNLGIEASLGCLYSRNAHLHELFPGQFRFAPANRIGRKMLNTAERYRHYPKRRRADIIHTTYYHSADLPSSGRFITTVYDMIPERLPHFFLKGNPHLAKKQYCENATLIACISEHTRRDLIDLYHIPEEKTRVVHLGIDVEMAQRNFTEVSGLPDRYILFVGSRGGYKNFSTLLDSFALLHLRIPELRLVCVGPKFSVTEQKDIMEAGLCQHVIQRSASDRELRSIYRRAAAFVFPSLYEGFGIPTLEALAQRCPVVLSDASCFPEIGRDAALYFNPRDPTACAEAIEQALNDVAGSKTRADRGEAICRELSWQNSAQRMAEIYHEVMLA